LSISTTDGRKTKYGLIKKPEIIYPRISGCFHHLKSIVAIPATININAKSLIISGKCSIND
jgi:hypothetical protein